MRCLLHWLVEAEVLVVGNVSELDLLQAVVVLAVVVEGRYSDLGIETSARTGIFSIEEQQV